jgi:hypothetical protein
MKPVHQCFFILAIAIVLSYGLAAEQSAQGKRASDRSKIDRVIENEKLVWEAAKQRDVTKFEELVAPDARIVFTTGVISRSDYIQGMELRSISDYQLENFEGMVPNPKTVILIYKATLSGTYRGKPFPSAPVYESSVWVERGKAWVAVLNQETPVKP